MMPIAGKTRKPTSASSQSVAISSPAVMNSISTTPAENGSGARGQKAASTSALALDSKAPVDWVRCHDSGSRWYCSVTLRR